MAETEGGAIVHEKDVRFPVLLRPATLKTLKKIAKDEQTSVSYLIRKSIANMLDHYHSHKRIP